MRALYCLIFILVPDTHGDTDGLQISNLISELAGIYQKKSIVIHSSKINGFKSMAFQG